MDIRYILSTQARSDLTAFVKLGEAHPGANPLISISPRIFFSTQGRSSGYVDFQLLIQGVGSEARGE